MARITISVRNHGKQISACPNPLVIAHNETVEFEMDTESQVQTVFVSRHELKESQVFPVSKGHVKGAHVKDDCHKKVTSYHLSDVDKEESPSKEKDLPDPKIIIYD